MLYIGMLFSMFAWHVEDHYLYSINYHHCGASKTWYGIPGKAAPDFENVVREHVYDHEILSGEGENAAFDVLLGKTTMFPPNILLRHQVPVYRAVQKPGEFVITFPRAYHSGFSHGFNCGEAVNFALGEWFPLGALASQRYALLKRTPILPYEELLCKEATLLGHQFSTCGYKDTTTLTGETHSQLCMKVPFVQSMRIQHRIRWSLMKMGARTHYKADIDATVLCGICRRDCYVAHIMCNCRIDAICLGHEEEIRRCPCSCDRVVFVRKDIFELETLSKKFEEESGILDAVKKQMARCDSPSQHSNLFNCIDYKTEYYPYYKIHIDPSSEIYSISETTFVGYDLNNPHPAASTVTFSFVPDEYSTQSDECTISNRRIFSSSFLENSITPENAIRNAYQLSTPDQTCLSDKLAAHDTDDSDCEIFRVKRRSGLTPKKRHMEDGTRNFTENQTPSWLQVLKRLKKINAHDRPEQKLPELSCCARSEPVHADDCRHCVDFISENGDDFMASTKLKMIHQLDANIVEDEVASSRKYNSCNYQSPSIELGPKRLKIRGPSFPSRISELEVSCRFQDNDLGSQHA